MRQTLIDQWHRETTAAQAAPPILQQCVTGAIRGALLGLVLLAVIFLIGWLGLL
ncbi:protein of unknown function [Methylorubrum extorquens]|uniref:Uncharacterized protein n=1 Tax=Methylorubrum extorquens TaxID=408 RepID=A0A2N9AIF8_METEX|nr:protein of unknown function [Methylorubrum extorquens]